MELFESLCNNPPKALRVLDLSGSFKSNNEFINKSLIKVLRNNRLITNLGMFETNLTYDECVKLLEAIRYHPSLRQVRFDMGHVVYSCCEVA